MESLDLGYADERFNEDVNEDLHCPICTNVLKQPVHCGTNEHYFCKVCITRHLENNQNCPCCMEGLVTKDLKPPSRFVTNRLSTLAIRCDNSDQGCQELVKLEDLSSHVNNCEFSPVVCSNDGCSLTMNKKDREHHELVACQFRKTECAACSELRNDLEEMKANIKEVKAQLQEMERVKEFFYPMTVEVLDNMKSVEEAFERLTTSDSVRENVIILGGCGKANSPLNSVELFNWSTTSWELLKPMYRSLGKSSAVVYKDQVIVSGGMASFPSNLHRHTEVTDCMETISLGSLTKDVSAGKWSKFPARMPEKRSAHKCVIYQDRLIVIGGFDNKKGKQADGIDEVLLTSPHTTKSIVSRMPCRRRYHGADLFGDKIVIAGGTSSGNMFECLDSVLEYNVNTKRHRDSIHYRLLLQEWRQSPGEERLC